MDDVSNDDNGTLRIRPKKTLTLNVPLGFINTVRQDFGHGRSKSVIVETRRRPGIGRKGAEPTLHTVPAPSAPTGDGPKPGVGSVQPVATAELSDERKRASGPREDKRSRCTLSLPVTTKVDSVSGISSNGGRFDDTQSSESHHSTGLPADPLSTDVWQLNSSSLPQRSLSDEERLARANALTKARQREIDSEKLLAQLKKAEEHKEQQSASERPHSPSAELKNECGVNRANRDLEESSDLSTEHVSVELERTDANLAASSKLSESSPIFENAALRKHKTEPVDEERNVKRGKWRSSGSLSSKKSSSGAKQFRSAGTARSKIIEPGFRSRGKFPISVLHSDNEAKPFRAAQTTKRRMQKQQRKGTDTFIREKTVREVTIADSIIIQELASRMSERAVDVIKLLMQQGHMLQTTDAIDGDTAQLVAEELGHIVRRISDVNIEEALFDTSDEDEKDVQLLQRAPVVTIMGHVDHGKTSLLDAIRSTKVADAEAGGITQHIGAYQIDFKGRPITFIDTPGHEAFASMRSRGAKVTDVVVLVVAADGGVMPTTVEAIHHTRAAQVPIIVAINKVDKPEADQTRVRTELLEHDVVVESMGGDVLEVEVSAKHRINIDGLMEAILLQADMQNLTVNQNGNAEGTVIEAAVDRGRGCITTLLIQRGTLRIGDIIVAGSTKGKVRALIDDSGVPVYNAIPSMPVSVLGFQASPESGDKFAVLKCESRARGIVRHRARIKNDGIQSKPATKASISAMMAQQSLRNQVFTLVMKTDVHGSLQAISEALEGIGNDEIQLQKVHCGVGEITESDVMTASTAKALIVGFNTRTSKQAKDLAVKEGVLIKYHSVIYELIDDIKKMMSACLEPELRETMIGTARVQRVFEVSKVGKVAGCIVTDGKLERSANIRLKRNGAVVYQGELVRLKRFKEETKDAVSGQECGVSIGGYQDIQDGDILECFRVESLARVL